MTLPTTFAELVQFDRDSVALAPDGVGTVDITQYPLGNTGSPATVPAILGKGFAHDIRSSGKQNVQNNDIWVSTSVTVDATDQWLIQGNLRQTVAWNTDVGGLTHVTLKAMQQTLRTGPGATIGGPR